MRLAAAGLGKAAKDLKDTDPLHALDALLFWLDPLGGPFWLECLGSDLPSDPDRVFYLVLGG